MKKALLFIVVAMLALHSKGQLDGKVEFTREDYFLFRTDSVIGINDTMKLLVIHLPDGFSVQKEQLGVLFGNPGKRKDSETEQIGLGRCKLIKGHTVVFSIKHRADSIPQVDDLLYTALYYPAKFKGRIYNLLRKAVYMKVSSGDSVYNFKTSFTLDESGEEQLIKKMLEDIQYVAREMKKQNDGQDQLISSGIFKGKRLFDAMEGASTDQLKSFLDYVIARPRIYALGAWNISEVFATWMVSGTPQVVKE